MDFLNSGSLKRAGLAPETMPVDIYALLMHRKHFTPIAATMDLILYRGRNITCTRRAFRCAASSIRYPVRYPVGDGGPFVSALFLRVSVASHVPFTRTPLTANRFGGLAEVQNVFINCPFN